MRLSEALNGVGRPIAYLPGLARVLGGVKAAVLFGQLWYWWDQKSGEFWKIQQELAAETGLTLQELRAARKELEQRGIVHSRYARIEHRLYFRIDRDRLDALWLKHNGHLLNSQVPPWDLTDGDVSKADIGSGRSETTSETTNREGDDTLPLASEKAHQKAKPAWPKDLALTPEREAYARARGIDGKAEFEAWRDHCASNGERNVDWSARWRTWIRRAVQLGKNNGGAASDSSPYATGAGERLKRQQEAIERERNARTPEEREAARREVARIVDGVVNHNGAERGDVMANGRGAGGEGERG